MAKTIGQIDSIAGSLDGSYIEIESAATSYKATLALAETADTVPVRSSTGTAFFTGISFPATQVPSSDANTLDDYEENTFVPGISFGGGVTGITYSSVNGRYTKIGNIVYFFCRIELSSKGSSSGDARITGLPFTSTSDSPNCNIRLVTVTFADFFWGVVTANSTTIDLSEVTNAGSVTTLTDANFSNNSIISATGFYFI